MKYATLLLFSLLVSTLAADNLKIELEVYRVLPVEDGSERFELAETASPGDIIEYRATYLNGSNDELSGVVPEIPVPAGLVFELPHVDTPEATLPSQVLINGSEWVAFQYLLNEETGVSPKQVSALRWSAINLGPQASQIVTFRASVAR